MWLSGCCSFVLLGDKGWWKLQTNNIWRGSLLLVAENGKIWWFSFPTLDTWKYGGVRISVWITCSPAFIYWRLHIESDSDKYLVTASHVLWSPYWLCTFFMHDFPIGDEVRDFWLWLMLAAFPVLPKMPPSWILELLGLPHLAFVPTRDLLGRRGFFPALGGTLTYTQPGLLDYESITEHLFILNREPPIRHSVAHYSGIITRVVNISSGTQHPATEPSGIG